VKSEEWNAGRLLPCLGLLLAFAALTAFEQDYLYCAQEQNLFLHTPLFFRQCMVTSGGLLTWAGAYLTQFFYYPMLGAGLLCLLWAFLVFLLRHTFRIANRWMWLTLIPVAMLLLADVCLGYWLYFLKLRGHLFVPTLGCIAAVALVYIYRTLPQRPLFTLHFPSIHHSSLFTLHFSTLFLAVASVASYPLFGFYGLLATALMGFLGRRRLTDRMIALTAIIAIPLLCYYTLYHQTPLANIWWTALPVFVHNGVSTCWHYTPYVLIVSWLIVAAAWHSGLKVYKHKHLPMGRVLSYFMLGLGVGILLLLILAWNKDDNFHRELTMSRQLEQQDWQAMLNTISASKGEPTRAMSIMKNLALQRQGRLSKDMKNYPDGFARPKAPFRVHLVHTVGKTLYLEFGIPNYCYRWCMEDGVEYGWSAGMLKLMVKCSLLNNELAAARRYLSLLKKTDFHRQWAKKYEVYIHRPSLMAQDAEFQAIRPLLRNDNFLTSDQSQLEPFLIEHLASSEGDTPEQLELRNICFKMYLNRNSYAEQ
jgi:hypothetical protein